MKAERTTLSQVALVVILGVGLCVGLYAVGNPFDPFDNSRFSARTWRTTPPESRARMARSVVRQLPPGTPETQVAALLGVPQRVLSGQDDGGHKLLGARTYSYSLGSWSEYDGFDDAYLYVHFDASDRVVGAEVSGY